MRLSPVELSALTKAIQGYPHRFFLFGSRCDENRTGGDVDVLVLGDHLTESERLAISLRVSARFQMICDEKIDVVVLDGSRLTPGENAFLGLIRPSLQPLAA